MIYVLYYAFGLMTAIFARHLQQELVKRKALPATDPSSPPELNAPSQDASAQGPYREGGPQEPLEASYRDEHDVLARELKLLQLPTPADYRIFKSYKDHLTGAPGSVIPGSAFTGRDNAMLDRVEQVVLVIVGRKIAQEEHETEVREMEAKLQKLKSRAPGTASAKGTGT